MNGMMTRLARDLTSPYLAVTGWTRRVRHQPRARRAARLQGVLAAWSLVTITSTLAAYAADGSSSGNVFLDSFLVKDSQGLSITKYELSIGGDAGMNPLTGAVQAMSAWLLTMGWDVYRMCVAVVLWLFDFALQFKLLQVFTPLAETLANVLASTMGRIGLVGGLTIIGFLFAVKAISSGKTALGVAEICMVILFSWAVTSPLANPVTMIAGGPGQDGWLRNSADSGIALSAQITSGGTNTSTNPDELKAQTSGQLVDVFVRVPHQLINYGAVIDNTKCKNVYDEVLKAGPYGSESTARDKVGGCNEAYKKAADHPEQGLLGLFTVGISSPVLILIALLLAAGLTYLTLLALYESATFVVDLVKGIIPGSSRSGAIESVGVIAVVCVTIIVDLFAIGVFNASLRMLFTADTGWNPLQIFMVLDLILICALCWIGASILHARKIGKKWGANASKALSPSAQSVATSRANPVGVAAKAVTNKVGQRVLQSSLIGSTLGTAAGSTLGQTAEHHQESAEKTRAGRLAGFAQGTAKATGAAAKLTLKSTIGAPVYGPRAFVAAKGAAKTAAEARKTAMLRQLAVAKKNARTKTGEAKAFGHEYAHNVGVGVRTLSKISGASRLAHIAVGLGAGPVAAGAMAGAAYFAQSTPNKRPNEASSFVRRDDRPAPKNPVPTKPRTHTSRSQNPTAPRDDASTGATKVQATDRPQARRDQAPSPKAPRQPAPRTTRPAPGSDKTAEQKAARQQQFLNTLRERRPSGPRPTNPKVNS